MKKSIHRTFFHFFGFEASAAHYLQIGIYEQTTCKSLKAPGINFLVAQLETEARQGELRFLMAATLSISDRNPVTGRTRWRERGKEIFGNLAVRHGIKFGIAGMLSVFLALLIRLPEPTWALITVFVVMLAQFVGAVAEKSVMRIIGTVAGGVIGYLLTAGLEQQPVLYVLLVGSVVGFGTAMFS